MSTVKTYKLPFDPWPGFGEEDSKSPDYMPCVSCTCDFDTHIGPGGKCIGCKSCNGFKGTG